MLSPLSLVAEALWHAHAFMSVGIIDRKERSVAWVIK